MNTDYLEVTEIAGDEVSREQVGRLCRRYYWAGDFCRDRDILEVACGTGQGLGYLAGMAHSLRAGDISPVLVGRARQHYRERMDIAVMDALTLPFTDASLDVVILFEAIYYLPDAARFAREAHRVLRQGGYLLIATANPDLYDFNPSPHSVCYFGVAALGELLEPAGFSCEFCGDTPVDELSMRQRILRPVKRMAVRMNLIPSTMAAKKILKRLIFGELVPMPAEIDAGTATAVPCTHLTAGVPDHSHKVIFCAARKTVR